MASVEDVNGVHKLPFNALASFTSLHGPLVKLHANSMASEASILSLFGANDQFQLLSDANRALIERVARSPRVILPFFGSNSCGKSTGLNALLGANLMPTGSGHVTARVCMLEYAPQDQSCIEFFHLNALVDGVAFDKQSIVGKSLHDLSELLSRMLSRDHAPSDRQSFESWLKIVVKIRYPFPLLTFGLTLVDLPGRSSTDDKAVQRLIRDYLRITHPPGVVLMYSNPTFSDAEVIAYEFLLEALPNKDPEQLPSIFLCSSKLDIKTILFDEDVEELDDDLLQQTLNRRYKLVSSRSLPLVKFPPNASQCLSFGCLNALEYLTTTEADYLFEPVQAVFQQFLKKIDSWTVDLQQRRYLTALSKIALGCDQLFRSLRDARSGRNSQVPDDAKSASSSVEQLVASIRSSIHPIVKQIPSWIEAKVNDPSFIEKSKKFGGELQLGLFEGVSVSGNELEAVGAFKSAFSVYIRNQLWTPILERCRSQISSEIEKLVAQFKQNAVSNEVLLQAIKATDVTNSNFLFVAPTNGIALSTSTNLSKAFKVFMKDFSGKGKSETINLAWKHSMVEHVLSHLRSDIMDPVALESSVMTAVNNYIVSLRAEIERQKRHSKIMLSYGTMLNNRPDLELRLISTFSKCFYASVALIQAAKNGQRQPNNFNSSPLAIGPSFEVFDAVSEYIKRPLGVSSLPLSSSTSRPNQFSSYSESLFFEFCSASGLYPAIAQNHHWIGPSHIWTPLEEYCPPLVSKSSSTGLQSSDSSSTLDGSSSSFDGTINNSSSSGSFSQPVSPVSTLLPAFELPPTSRSLDLPLVSTKDSAYPSKYLLIYDKVNLSGLVQCPGKSLSSETLFQIASSVVALLQLSHSLGAVFGAISSYSIWIPENYRDLSDDEFTNRLRICALGQPPSSPSPYPSDEPITTYSDIYAFGVLIRELINQCSEPDKYPLLQAVGPCFHSLPSQRPSAESLLRSINAMKQ